MSNLPPIVIVDDDADDAFILRRLLVKSGLKNKVVAFEDARAAVVYLQAQISSGEAMYFPCVIFSDLSMPRMDGVELVQWVRAQPALARTLIVVVSSSENPRDHERCLAAGAARFLSKYPTPAALHEVIEQSRCGTGREP